MDLSQVLQHTQHRLVVKPVEKKGSHSCYCTELLRRISRCWVQEQERDYRLKKVLKEAVFSVEKPDRFHFLSKRRTLGCGGRLSTGFGGGQQYVAYRMIKPAS